MSSPSTPPESGIDDSVYEIVASTDGESQDGCLTESVSSLDYPRTDDVHSLDDESDNGYHSDTDDEAEHRSSASSIRYADEALQNPSTPPAASSHLYRPPPQQTTTTQSIEFVEGDEEKDGPLFLGKISVKHTIRKFTDEETKTIVQAMDMSESPRRLVATVRQTMSPGCLSTREPLRILYIGSPGARMDIIYKISSAICASGTHCRSDSTVKQSSEGVFNIFPISDFGSTNLPDVHLLESSGRQIRVEDCTSAEEIVIKGGSFPGDTVYSLTVDKDKTYRSLFSPSGSTIQPAWTTLPHIAIFFFTENDDQHAQNTRNFAWEFMNRHGIPSIFISNNQTFTKTITGRWQDFVDQHAVHLCLESRDPEKPALSQRLPIDLTSFLNIDARQMNRNLTYLTGLVEYSDLDRSEATVMPPSAEEGKGYPKELFPEPLTFLCTARRVVRTWAEQNRGLIFMGTIFLTSIIAVSLSAFVFRSGLSPLQATTLSTVSPTLVRTAGSTTPTRAAPTATTTVMINVTSTKTVQILKTEASASTLASALSFAGFLSDKPSGSVSDAETRKTICAAERHSNHEILIKLPPSSKASWLAKGAIDIDVYRGKEYVKTKLSSTDEGIVVEINKNDAYGVLTLSVITTRKPKINETFEVNFGKPITTEVIEAGIRIFQSIAEEVVNTAHGAGGCISGLAEVAESLRQDTESMLDRIRDAGRALQSYPQTLKEQTVVRAKESLNHDRVAQFLADARKGLLGRLGSADNLRDNVSLAVLKAQIASKLWWLKLQGRTKDSAEYERNATRLLKYRYDQVAKARETELRDASHDKSFGQCRAWRGCGSPWRNSKDARWKKMLVG